MFPTIHRYRKLYRNPFRCITDSRKIDLLREISVFEIVAQTQHTFSFL